MSAALAQLYAARRSDVLEPVALELEQLLRSHCAGIPHIDRISARAKAVERFLAKAEKVGVDGAAKYSAPMEQIQDQVAARIIVFYRRDVDLLNERLVDKYFRHREAKLMEPSTDEEFGYFGKHYILELPGDAIPRGVEPSAAPEVFELQIKTLFQHAWSEANHDLGYKSATGLTAEQKRLIAYSSAQAWGADRVFEELASELAGDIV